MSIMRIFALANLLMLGLIFLPQNASAGVAVGVSAGGYYPAHGYHHYRPYYHRPYYYRPYYYSPFYYGWGWPYYGFGFGYGFGYPYYGYPDYSGDVRTEVKPKEARVFVDGGYAGIADDFDGWWQRLELEPGNHRLVFRAPGFAPYVVDVQAIPGNDTHIKYNMAPGQDVIAENEMRLPESEYRRDDYQRRDHPPEGYRGYRSQPYPPSDRRPPEDRDYWGRERHPEEYGRPEENYDNPPPGPEQPALSLHIEPADATVYIDGNYYGTANDNGRGELRVILPEGLHRIEVVRPGFETYSQDIQVQRGGENRVSIILQKK